jgi:hypothetical protein
MSRLNTTLRFSTAAALMGGFACLGTANASADPTDALISSLSKGYSMTGDAPNCKSIQLDGTAATIECGHNADPNGPLWARYALFNNATDLATSFTTSSGALTQGNCGDKQSPGSWGTTQGHVDGQEACGTYQGQAEIVWTWDSRNVLAAIRSSGGDVDALHNWWLKS